MVLSKLDECMEKGQIKKVSESREDAEKSLLRARRWLVSAEVTISAEVYDSCLLAAYESMFHAARAILIKDGYRERSHYCIARYLDERYAKKGLLDGKIIDMIDNYRELRHEAAYSTEFESDERDAKNMIRDAKIVLNAVSKLIDT